MDARRIPKFVDLLCYPLLIAARALGEFLHDKSRLLPQIERIIASFPPVPNVLLCALVAAEDRRFFDHRGVDFFAIGRSIVSILFRGRLQGGSTIEQQLVRVLTNKRERTLRRKFLEISQAAWISSKLSKEQLSTAYLLTGYFGFATAGVFHTCKQLQFDICKLSLLEASYVVARLRYPAHKKPRYLVAQKIRARSKFILSEVFADEHVHGKVSRHSILERLR